MIPVSNGWKALQNQTLLPEMFVEVTSIVTEPGLQEDATVSSDSSTHYSNIERVLGTPDVPNEKYATLERGAWGLDGESSYFGDLPSNTGYISGELSDEDCVFVIPPRITFTFFKQHTEVIPGLTIVWSEEYGEWASDFTVTAYNSNGVVARTVVTGNKSVESVVWMDLSGYSRITIEVSKWSLPFHRARCGNVFLGIRRIYTKNDLLGYEQSHSVDLLSATLPKGEITFRLRNDTNQWNPDNPSGFEKYLLEQQEIQIRYGMDVNGTTEWIKGGTYWLSDWETPSNGMEAVFKAKDAVSFMVNTYTGHRLGTLYDIAVLALEQADLQPLDNNSQRYFVDESLREIQTDFLENTQNYSIAQILQMVAHAGGCVFYQDRDGVVRIEPRSMVYSGYMIEPMISYSHPEYTINKPLKSVSVGYGDGLRAIVDVDSKGEVQTIDNPLILTEEDAIRVGEKAKEVLTNRKVITGEFRADMRLDALDNIVVVSKYASNVIGVTDVKYSTTGGGFKGTYTGRVVSVELNSPQYHVGELYVGEV